MNRCKSCRHPDRPLIDAGIVAGVSYRTIADRFSISQTALKRHAKAHIPELLRKARENADAISAENILRDVYIRYKLLLGAFDEDIKAVETRSLAIGNARVFERIARLLLEVKGSLPKEGGTGTALDSLVMRECVSFITQRDPDGLPDFLGRFGLEKPE